MKYTQKDKEEMLIRLKEIISKKFTTATIFPLSQVELMFGELWGAGLSEDKLTDEEKIYRSKWYQCRQNILNLGNQQKRNALSELDLYSVERKTYETILVPIENIKDNYNK